MLRFVLLALFLALPAKAEERLLVFAAASQRDAMNEIGTLYEMRCGCKVVFSFAATSTLARQIDAGAGADVFVSANEAWADWLEIRNGLDKQTRTVIAGNRLVIASAHRTQESFNILRRGRFAMADPVSVPAGIYGREALESIGIWRDVRGNAVYTENVRVALSSILRGDLLAGIVYESDLKIVPELHAQFVFPDQTHAPIHYVAASISGSVEGAKFVLFLKQSEAQEILQRFGFLPASATN
ncbi:MAG: molybdate ABC transporter substrate-binding protein [Pseudomonadota bacterium]